MSNADQDPTLSFRNSPAPTLQQVNATRVELHPDAMTIDHLPAMPHSGLHVRCPHCHNPIELLPDAELDTINCSTCGSNFSLTSDDDPTRDARGVTQVGHFKLVERLGMGGFGAVWKAHDTELDRTVAIKIPRSGQLDKLHQDLFLREARSAAQLRHPNIVPVFEVGRDGDTLYIVSEFVRGVTLADRLTAGPLASREAVEICAKMADALHHAHEQGVIHRDLKPANVMLDSQGEPHLMDFGLARREANEITMTMEGQVLGTPAYMSPEQAQGEGHTADRRTDVYSLGVMLFQLLTGELPFRGNSRMLVHQVIHDEPPSPRKLNSSVPRDLETITLKCMEKDPHRRFATSAELAEEFRRYLAGEPISARPITKVERGWRWAKRKPLVAGLTAAVLGLMTFVAISAPIVAVRQASLRKVAEEKELSANDAKAAAEMRERQAKESEKQAQESEQQAKLAHRNAEEAQQRLLAAQEISDRTNYAHTISLAQQEWINANITQCEDLLDTTDLALRGWEWDYLKQLCHSEMKSLVGLSDTPNRFAFHKDGKHFAGFIFQESQIRVWDIETGNLVSNSPMAPWAISRDGSTAVGNPASGLQQGLRELNLVLTGKAPLTSDHMGRLTIFDVLTGKFISHIVAPGQFGFPHFSWDGSRLVTSSTPGNSIRVWDTALGTQIGQALDLNDLTVPSTISPDGRKIACRTADGVRIHDATTQKEELGLPTQSGGTFVAFNNDATLAAASSDDEVLIWDLATGKTKLILRGHMGQIARCEFSPTMPLIATWGNDNTARVWSTDTGRELVCLRGHRRFDTYSFSEIAFNADGTLLATGGGDKTIKIWDIFANDAPTQVLENNELHPFDPQGKDTKLLSQLNLRQDLDWVGGGSRIFDIDFTNDGQFLAAADADGYVKLWNVETHALSREFKDQNNFVCTAVRASPDGKLIAAGYGGSFSEMGAGRIVIFEHETGNILQTWDNHDVIVTALRFNADGTRLVSTANWASDKVSELFVWDVISGKLLTKIEQLPEVINGMDFSSDGKTIAVSGSNGQVHLWSALSGEYIKALGQTFDISSSVSFSPDDKTLVAGSEKWSLTLFDIESGNVLWKIFEHSGRITDVSFAGAERILTAGADGVAKLWDAKTGTNMLTLRDRDKAIERARMSPDQRTVVCAADTWLSFRRIPEKTKNDTIDWETLVSDDFESGRIGDAWKIFSGAWTVENGVAKGVQEVDPEFSNQASAALALKMSLPSIVEISYDTWSPEPSDCEIKLSDPAAKKSLIALSVGKEGTRFNRGMQGYAVVMQVGRYNYQEVASRRAEIETGKKYRLRAIRNQSRWRMFVDDQLLLETDVPENLSLPALLVNACHGDDGDVFYVDNVLIRAPKAEAAPPVGFQEN